MRYIIIFCMMLLFFSGCKKDENSSNKNTNSEVAVIESEESNDGLKLLEKSSFLGKISNVWEMGYRNFRLDTVESIPKEDVLLIKNFFQKLFSELDSGEEVDYEALYSSKLGFDTSAAAFSDGIEWALAEPTPLSYLKECSYLFNDDEKTEEKHGKGRKSMASYIDTDDELFFGINNWYKVSEVEDLYVYDFSTSISESFGYIGFLAKDRGEIKLIALEPMFDPLH